VGNVTEGPWKAGKALGRLGRPLEGWEGPWKAGKALG